MYKAVGTTFVAKNTKRMLLNLRSKSVSYPHTWSFWGGKIEKGEQPIDALRRELTEEMGFVPQMEKLNPLDTYRSPDKGFIYYTYVIITPKEFIPTLNSESSGYAWIDIGKWPKPLHSGAKITLTSKKNISKIKKLCNLST
jgi:8-oxo-dGTP pyrophosphatase MutT (NUDIX family)|tara:strand:+ start:388 stop:810 length:423 start_codon:yes stop_codon:yes gene_type:complete